MRILSLPITRLSLKDLCGQASVERSTVTAALDYVLDRRRTSLGSIELRNDLADRSRSHRPSAFADGKAQALFHGHRRYQLDGQRNVVARHHHLGAGRQFSHARHVRGAEIKLRTIAL